MKCLMLYTFTFILWLSSGVSFASSLTHLDQSNLVSAIDDYLFSDYDTAISKLKPLHEKSPNNAHVLQYLALSYDESGKPEQAMPMFKAWLRVNQYTTDQHARFAWIGLANTQIKTKQTDEAITTLKTWLNAHPEDIESKITLGDLWIRQNNMDESLAIWESILSYPDATSSHKAAAWYYKSWIAYLDADPDNAQKYAQQSLNADAESAYASAAKQLKANPNLPHMGFHAYASMEAFYHSNVIFAPENSSTYSRDLGIQSTVSLGWGFKHAKLRYILSSTTHQDFKAYDLMVHMLSLAWKKSTVWKFKPSYEYVLLNTDKLYQSLGLGIDYKQPNWTYQYTFKYKSFNSNYGDNNIDLTRLGGNSHHVGANRAFHINNKVDIEVMPFFIMELTKGDANHDKTDSYYQFGTNITTTMPLTQHWITQLKLNTYARFYAAADTNILLDPTDSTKRQDLYIKLTTSTSWKPWQDYDISWVVNASYLINHSNYNDTRVISSLSKSYSAWRVGSMLTGQW